MQHVTCPEPQRKSMETPSLPMECIIVEMKPLAVSHIAQTQLVWHQHVLFVRFISNFHLLFQPTAIFLQLRYSVSNTKFELSRVITFKDDFMKVNLTIASISELRINTELKKKLKNLYQIRYIDKKISIAACRLG